VNNIQGVECSKDDDHQLVMACRRCEYAKVHINNKTLHSILHYKHYTVYLPKHYTVYYTVFKVLNGI